VESAKAKSRAGYFTPQVHITQALSEVDAGSPGGYFTAIVTSFWLLFPPTENVIGARDCFRMRRDTGNAGWLLNPSSSLT
jgi:hypothetical protein